MCTFTISSLTKSKIEEITSCNLNNTIIMIKI